MPKFSLLFRILLKSSAFIIRSVTPRNIERLTITPHFKRIFRLYFQRRVQCTLFTAGKWKYAHRFIRVFAKKFFPSSGSDTVFAIYTYVCRTRSFTARVIILQNWIKKNIKKNPRRDVWRFSRGQINV